MLLNTTKETGENLMGKTPPQNKQKYKFWKNLWKNFAAICNFVEHNAESWFFYALTTWDYPCEHIQNKWLCLEEFSSVEEEEYAQLNEEHKQLQDEN